MKKQLIKLLGCVSLMLFSIQTQAQETVTSSGGEATGTGGTVSFTIGQVNYQTNSGANGSVAQGVQQAFEIWVTSVNDIPGITLNVEAYPNPTQGDLWLNVDEFSGKDLTYQVYDFSGKLLMSSSILDSKTRISLQKYASATYFLKIRSAQSEIKTFKIIKN